MSIRAGSRPERGQEVVEHRGLHVDGEPVGVEERLHDQPVRERDRRSRQLFGVGIRVAQLVQPAGRFEMRPDRPRNRA